MREFASLQGDQWLKVRGAEIVLALALAPAFAWMNPFFSQQQPFLPLVGFWSSSLVGWFMLMAIVERALGGLDIVRQRPPVMQEAIVIAVAAFPMIFVVGAGIHALKGWTITPLDLIETYFQILLIGSGVTLIASSAFAPRSRMFASGRTQEPALTFDSLEPTPASEFPQAAEAPERLLSRLPLTMRGQILCLEMEDHYVRVHTDRGSALVLLRLSDAIAEAQSSVPGQQVHRSWWVADQAIERFERVGRTAQLHLSCGLTAPVSQRYLKLVEEACAGKSAARQDGSAAHQ